MREIQYQQNGDYLIPTLQADIQPEEAATKFGMMRESFLKENADRLHTVVLSSGGKEIVAGIYPTSDSRFGHAGYYEPAAPVGIVTNAINLGTAAAALMWLSAIPE